MLLEIDDSDLMKPLEPGRLATGEVVHTFTMYRTDKVDEILAAKTFEYQGRTYGILTLKIAPSTEADIVTLNCQYH